MCSTSWWRRSHRQRGLRLHLAGSAPIYEKLTGSAIVATQTVIVPALTEGTSELAIELAIELLIEQMAAVEEPHVDGIIDREGEAQFVVLTTFEPPPLGDEAGD